MCGVECGGEYVERSVAKIAVYQQHIAYGFEEREFIVFFCVATRFERERLSGECTRLHAA